jgi:precorrin-3B C17-methyltransferase
MANRLYVVSSGIGGEEFMTKRAVDAIRESQVVVSYHKYSEEVSGLLKGKEIYLSGMTREIDRCQEAIRFARSGKTTSIISNGDVNVYGMATLIVELMDEMDLWGDVKLEVISGVTSILAVASKVGAPIGQDFAVVSLSDRLTPKRQIQKRVQSALEGDFVIGIYNPKSKKRIEPYREFLDILKGFGDRVVVVASNVGREDEKIAITTSKKLVDNGTQCPDITMSTMLLVGNSNTKVTKSGLVLTPRGYLNKYDLSGAVKW